MRPLEAYETVMRFAAERGEPALRLALHAAVPQSFRPGFLHLLRLNFVPEAPHEAESDVLLSPFSEETGGGYYQFDPEARRLLLDHLDPTYPDEKVPRLQRVADFLVTYIEKERRRLSADQDRLATDYLAIQDWVALAFLHPENAAVQLAAALDQGTQADIAARVQFSGLASALSLPLVKYPKLLTYAAGLEALEQGRTADAASLLERLPDGEIKIGQVTLRSPRALLRKQSAAHQSSDFKIDPDLSGFYDLVKAVPHELVPGYVFLSYASEDSSVALNLRRELEQLGIRTWEDWFLSSPTQEPEEDRFRREIELSTVFVALLSQHTRDFSRKRFSRIQREEAARIAQESTTLTILPVTLDDTDLRKDKAWLPDLFYELDWFNLRSRDDLRRLVGVIREILLERASASGPAPA